MPGQQFIKPMRGMGGDAREDVGEPSLRIDVVELGGRDQSVNGSGATTSFVRAGEGPILSFQGDGPQLAFGGIVKGYGAREAAFPTGIRALVKACNGYRDGGVGSTKRRQAVLSMSCELELLHGRPYDLPGCAASTDP